MKFIFLGLNSEDVKATLLKQFKQVNMTFTLACLQIRKLDLKLITNF